MKQLLSLVLKDIRRQRFRTTLTFLCILLSVFVFNLLCDSFVVMRGIMIEDVTDFSGTWEVNLDRALAKAADPDAAIETIRNSRFVDSYFLYHHNAIYRNNSFRDRNSCQEFLEMSLNGQEPGIISSFSQIDYDGDRGLNGKYSFNITLSNTADNSSPTLRLPRSYQKAGWKVGDEVSVTLRVFTAKLTDDQPALKDQIEARVREYKEMNGEDAEYRIFADSPGELPALFDGGLIYAVSSRHLMSELVMEETASAEPYTFTATISGFYNFEGGEPELTARNSEIDITKCLNGPYADRVKINPYYDGNSNSDHGMDGFSAQSILIRTPQNLDFDDTLEAICEEIGLSAEQTDDVLHPTSPGEKSAVYTLDYLSLMIRGSDAIAAWFTNMDMLIAVAAFCGIAILIWALMRFVIDNCFEISVQERSAQFATLRIMGASRRQVSIIVGFEALFYCIAAVPLGTVLSHLCRIAVLSALSDYGFVIREASFPILTVLAVFLALTAILISAYTSSMWAARAYNPLEAAKKTHLKGNRKETIWTKNLFGTKKKPTKQEKKAQSKAKPTGDLKQVKVSRLNRKQKSFLRNYTMRNIRRTRSRFLISVISMSLGTMLFAFGLTIGLAIFFEVREEFDYSQRYDFIIGGSGYASDVENTFNPVKEYLNHTDIFSEQKCTIRMDTAVDYTALLETLKNDLDNLGFRRSNSETPALCGMTEEIYNSTYKDTIGMDYQSFLKTGGVLIEDNLCGTIDHWKLDENGRLQPVM
ncbi:MAG: ABC transporter permease, partial [Oscillospiraceae bacterium]|nr:ABC transporter permease [Oscillospiraceae bacterium]